MNRTALITGIGISAALAAAALVFNASQSVPQAPAGAADTVDPATYFDPSAGTGERIRALELAVAEERNARLLLEEELQALYAAIDELAGRPDARNEPAMADDGTAAGPDRAFRPLQQMETAEDRVDRLVAAGFSPERAEWIVKREAELQMAQMQEIYDARRDGRRPDRSVMDADRSLRQELGDSQYGQYLEANGRPTSVRVGSVLDASPGQRAGLLPGDEIVAYGGERVFSYADLHDATLGAESGQPVVVDIRRDGMPMQVVIESGPIGISNRSFTIGIRR